MSIGGAARLGGALLSGAARGLHTGRPVTRFSTETLDKVHRVLKFVTTASGVAAVTSLLTDFDHRIVISYGSKGAGVEKPKGE